VKGLPRLMAEDLKGKVTDVHGDGVAGKSVAACRSREGELVRIKPSDSKFRLAWLR
jgi:hypothetical protein